MKFDYGCNNEKAFKEGECIDGKKHDWRMTKTLSRCYTSYICDVCGSTMRIDSGD